MILPFGPLRLSAPAHRFPAHDHRRRPAAQRATRSVSRSSATSRSSSRSWSGFQNFAISFTIISILAGCFTTYGQAWNNGGPVAISWGWPLISIPILIIGFCMSELVSAYPTAGGIYWWASKLGGAAWGWFTGWFNLIGLVAVTASVDYGCATFMNTVFGLYDFNLFKAQRGRPNCPARDVLALLRRSSRCTR